MRSVEKGTKDADRKVKSSADAMSGAFMGVGAIAGAVFGSAVVGAMSKAVRAASDLQEVAGKFGVVFADQMAQAEANATVLIDSYRHSQDLP
jgi:hypothetical protein